MIKKQNGLLLLFLFLSFSILQAQFRLNESSSKSLVEVLDELSAQYNLHFAYPSVIVGNQEINVSNENFATIEDLLNYIFTETNLEFYVQGNTNVLIRQKIVQPEPIQKIKLFGSILSTDNGTALEAASVYLDDFSKGSFTSNKGQFTLWIDKNDFDKNIIISYLGHSEKIIPVTELVNQKSIIVKLEQSLTLIQDIIIMHTKPMMKTNVADLSIQIDKKMVNHNMLGGADIFRTIQALPGINASNDDSAGIQIRGSNAIETMIILDDIPIYNANHYYGVFSSINSSFVNQIALYKNVIPIENIGASAGLLKMKSESSPQKTNGSIKMNLLNTSASIDARLSDRINLSLAGRSTITNINSLQLFAEDKSLADLQNLTDDFNEQFLQTDPTFNYYDVNARIGIKLSKRSLLNFSAFYSKDKYENEYENELTTEKKNEIIINNESLNYTEDWDNFGTAISFEHILKEKLKLKASVHHSTYQKNSLVDSKLLITKSDTIISRNNDYLQFNSILDRGAKVFIEKENHFKLGLSYNFYETKFNLDDFSNSEKNSITSNDDKSNQISLFGSYTFNFKKLSVNLGSRVTSYFSLYNRTVLSPQIIGSYKIDSASTLKFSVGENNQFLRKIKAEDRFGHFRTVYQMADNGALPIGKSLNYMLGYGYKLSEWSFDVELFYKDIKGIVEFANVNPGFKQDESSTGSSTSGVPPPTFSLYIGNCTAVGADFLVSYQGKRYTTWMAYTLSKVQNQVKELYMDQPYPSQNDRRHQLKWISQYHLKNWNLNSNFVISNGTPYISYVQNSEINSRESLSPETIIKSLPFYARIDFGISYSFPLFKKNASLSFSVLNLTNRQNVKFYQQTFDLETENRNEKDIEVGIGNESNLLNRTFDVGLNFNF